LAVPVSSIALGAGTRDGAVPGTAGVSTCGKVSRPSAAGPVGMKRSPFWPQPQSRAATPAARTSLRPGATT